jgi:hypothetical protein
MNKYLSTHTIEHKKPTTYVVQAQQCGGGKPINGIGGIPLIGLPPPLIIGSTMTDNSGLELLCLMLVMFPLYPVSQFHW